MKIEFHTLYWPGTNQRIVDAHKEVMEKFGFPVNYTIQRIDHGEWMSIILENSKSEIICFFDIDCVPLNREEIIYHINQARLRKNFTGIAQVSNHIPPAKHIYAAPAFFVIHKECWNKVNVSMIAGSDGKRAGDVCELFTYAAEDMNIPFGLLMPKYYYKEPKEGIWNLSDKGCYGIGTIFCNTVYHLYQSRFSENIDIFIKHSKMIIDGNLNLKDFIEVKNYE